MPKKQACRERKTKHCGLWSIQMMLSIYNNAKINYVQASISAHYALWRNELLCVKSMAC